jgi:hypothetical protein
MGFSAYCLECGEAKYTWAQTFHLALLLLAEYPQIIWSIFVNALKGKYFHFSAMHVLSITPFGILIVLRFLIRSGTSDKMGRDISVGIATGYRMDGPLHVSGEGEIIRTCPDRPRAQPILLYNGYWVFPGSVVF